MSTRSRPLLSPLSPSTVRMYPTCRTLAYQRRRLGLTQTRLAAVCLIAALDIPDALKQAFAAQMRTLPTMPAGDVTKISGFECGDLKHRESIVQSLQEVCLYLQWPSVYSGEDSRKMRERLNLSQTRLATIFLIVACEMSEKDKRLIVGKVVANQIGWSSATDQPAVSLIETGGGKKLTQRDIAVFCQGFSLAMGTPISPEFLFDDWLEEMAESQLGGLQPCC